MGFVGQKNKEHSNQSSLYLTLSPLTLFDTKYSECGRVLSSLRPLEYVDLGSLQIQEVIPLFSYEKKSEFSKKKLLEKRCKFFEKKVRLSGQYELENFIFETIENEKQYLTGPKELHISDVNEPGALIRLREINLVDLDRISLTHCSLTKEFFTKVLLEKDYLPRLSKLDLKDLEIDKWCFTKVCQLGLESLVLDNITLKKSKIRLFPLLCLESHFFPNLKTLSLRNILVPKDLDILKVEYLSQWIELANGRPLSSINLNKLKMFSTQSTNRMDPSRGNTSKSEKENKSSSTKKGNSKTSKKSSSKKSSSRESERQQKKNIAKAMEFWIEKLGRFGESLEHLTLNDNCLYDEGLEKILQTVRTTNLQTLELRNTSITSKSEPGCLS